MFEFLLFESLGSRSLANDLICPHSLECCRRIDQSYFPICQHSRVHPTDPSYCSCFFSSLSFLFCLFVCLCFALFVCIGCSRRDPIVRVRALVPRCDKGRESSHRAHAGQPRLPRHSPRWCWHDQLRRSVSRRGQGKTRQGLRTSFLPWPLNNNYNIIELLSWRPSHHLCHQPSLF
jgi:hypothetical protein